MCRSIEERSGPSWENRIENGWLTRIVQTWVNSLFHPIEFFSNMRIHGDFLSPLLYSIIINFIGTIGVLSVQMNIPKTAFWKTPMLDAYSLSSGIIFVSFVILSPILTIISSFIGAGILHFCLFIAGGVKSGFEATFRVVCYSTGPTIFSIIPICGGLISWLWIIPLQVIGLTKSHKPDTWRSVLAVLLPFICCCCVAVTFVLSMTGLIAYMGSE